MKQAERRAKTHRALLEAATRSFARSGYAATSLDQISAEAGLSKGGLYAHFPTKLALYLEVAEATLSAAEERLRPVADALREGASPAAAAQRYLRPPDATHIALVADLWHTAITEPLARERLEAYRQARLARLGEACVDAGDAPARALERARTTAAMIDALVLESRLGLALEA